MAISFLHTADLQIGKVFGTADQDAATLLRRQRLKTVQRIAQLATDRQVDAVLVAGDVFETDAVSNETVYGLLQSMEPYKGPWVIIPGNHDPAIAESVWTRLEVLGRPENLKIARRPETFTLANGRMTVLTAPLQRRHESEDLTAVWDALPTPEGAVRVGLAHGSVTNHAPAGAEATNPIAGDRERLARLDYLALGDWHGTLQVGDRTWYSGTPEPDRFKANDSGNVLLVETAGPGEQPKVEKLRVAHYTWEHLQYSFNCADDLVGLEVKLRDLGEPFDQRVVALTLTGAVDLDTKGKLARFILPWRARFLWLREDFEGLIARPTKADLDRVDDKGGFVRTALNRLCTIQTDQNDPNQPYASGALELLYQIHAGAETK